MRSFCIALLLTLSLQLSAPFSTVPEARAMSQEVRTVWITAFYGVLGGAAVGLIAWPMTGSSRSFFQGMSAGLYMGIGLGVFVNMPDRYGMAPSPHNLGTSLTAQAPSPGREFRFEMPVWTF